MTHTQAMNTMNGRSEKKRQEVKCKHCENTCVKSFAPNTKSIYCCNDCYESFKKIVGPMSGNRSATGNRNGIRSAGKIVRIKAVPELSNPTKKGILKPETKMGLSSDDNEEEEIFPDEEDEQDHLDYETAKSNLLIALKKANVNMALITEDDILMLYDASTDEDGDAKLGQVFNLIVLAKQNKPEPIVDKKIEKKIKKVEKKEEETEPEPGPEEEPVATTKQEKRKHKSDRDKIKKRDKADKKRTES